MNANKEKLTLATIASLQHVINRVMTKVSGNVMSNQVDGVDMRTLMTTTFTVATADALNAAPRVGGAQ